MRVVNMRSLGFLKRLQLAYSGFLFHVYCGDILRFLYRRAESYLGQLGGERSELGKCVVACSEICGKAAHTRLDEAGTLFTKVRS
jgi:hypothetical protein